MMRTRSRPPSPSPRTWASSVSPSLTELTVPFHTWHWVPLRYSGMQGPLAAAAEEGVAAAATRAATSRVRRRARDIEALNP